MAVTAGYPSGAESTGVAAPVTVAQSAELASLALYDNSEIDIVDISYASNTQPFLKTLVAIGKLIGGNSPDTLGLTEMVSNNYPEFKYMEQDEEQKVFALTVAANTVVTTLTLASTAGLIPGYVLRNTTTSEVIRILTIASATTITVVRGVGTIAGAAIGTSDTLYLIGMAAGVGTFAPTALGSAAATKSNYFQKFTTSVVVNDKDMLQPKVGFDTRGSFDRLMAKKANEHGKQCELAALLGEKSTGVDAAGNEVNTMEGLVPAARLGWTSDISSSLTRKILDNTLSTPMYYKGASNMPKILMCGTNVRATISDLFYKDQVRSETLEGDSIKLRVDKLSVQGGEYILVTSPYMNKDTGLAGHAIALDPAYVKMVYAKGTGLQGNAFDSKTKFNFLASESNYAIQKGDYVTQFTMQYANRNSMAFIKVV